MHLTHLLACFCLHMSCSPILTFAHFNIYAYQHALTHICHQYMLIFTYICTCPLIHLYMIQPPTFTPPFPLITIHSHTLPTCPSCLHAPLAYVHCCPAYVHPCLCPHWLASPHTPAYICLLPPHHVHTTSVHSCLYLCPASINIYSCTLSSHSLAYMYTHPPISMSSLQSVPAHTALHPPLAYTPQFPVPHKSSPHTPAFTICLDCSLGLAWG